MAIDWFPATFLHDRPTGLIFAGAAGVAILAAIGASYAIWVAQPMMRPAAWVLGAVMALSLLVMGGAWLAITTGPNLAYFDKDPFLETLVLLDQRDYVNHCLVLLALVATAALGLGLFLMILFHYLRARKQQSTAAQLKSIRLTLATVTLLLAAGTTYMLWRLNWL
ncbi:MAG TPA: hypothetical protein VLI05_00490 [Candidatus Saccharimonadia bacterium]|nr:hypothetical protein [Candidatus Saccharimonadia bacterium]